jgi:pyruvate,water dikinase
VTTTTEAPVLARPACDWDSPDNPTFNTWTTVNLAEVFPGVSWPFDATWYHRWQKRCHRTLLQRLQIEDLVPLYDWPVPNFLGFWAGQCAANVAFTAAIASTWVVGGSSSAVEQFFTSDEPGGARAYAAADVARARQTRSRYFRILGQMAHASLADQARSRRLALSVAAAQGQSSPAALRAWLGRVESLAENNFYHHIVTSLGAGEYASLLDDHLRAALDDLPADAVLTLTSGLGDVESAKPSQALWELSRWARSQPSLRRALPSLTAEEIGDRLAASPKGAWADLASRFSAFIDDYGYRGQTEWMLALPDWSEDWTFPLNSLRNMVPAPDDGGPSRLQQAALARRQEAEREYRGRLPEGRRRCFDELLATAQHLVRLREFTKSNCIRGIRPGRQVMLSLAGQLVGKGVLETRDDAFYLFADEVDEALAGKLGAAEAAERVARRRQQRRDLEGYVLPDNFTGTPRIVRRQVEERDTSRLNGLGVSPGVASGPACVVTDLQQAGGVTMEKGDVLVAPFTDAPWTPLFLLASAVVVETGGLLSHAATVAREYGIPAVVMVKGATALIADGQTVTVDGSSGEVCVA